MTMATAALFQSRDPVAAIAMKPDIRRARIRDTRTGRPIAESSRPARRAVSHRATRRTRQSPTPPYSHATGEIAGDFTRGAQNAAPIAFPIVTARRSRHEDGKAVLLTLEREPVIRA